MERLRGYHTFNRTVPENYIKKITNKKSFFKYNEAVISVEA